MAVAAYQCGAGEGEPLFRAHDVNDPLRCRDRIDIIDPEVTRIALKRVELLEAFRIDDRQPRTVRVAARSRRQIVIGDRKREIGTTDSASVGAQPGEGLRAGDLMDEVTINVDQAGSIVAALDHVIGPDLFVQGQGLVGHAARSSRKLRKCNVWQGLYCVAGRLCSSMR